VSIPRKTRLAIYARHGWRCWYCGESFVYLRDPTVRWCEIEPPTIEHQVPLSKGGLTRLANLVMACKTCNSTKRTKTVEEYRAWLLSKQPISRALKALTEITASRANIDPSVLETMAWLQGQLPSITFWGEHQPLD
jgi:5-methylcytosine-specific restriction endonuclease McrA